MFLMQDDQVVLSVHDQRQSWLNFSFAPTQIAADTPLSPTLPCLLSSACHGQGRTNHLGEFLLPKGVFPEG